MLMLHHILQYTQTLTLVTHWYNQLHSTILAVELGLVKDDIDGMKSQLEPALQELTWVQDDLWNYIQTTQDMVKVLNMSCISKGNPITAQRYKEKMQENGIFPVYVNIILHQLYTVIIHCTS